MPVSARPTHGNYKGYYSKRQTFSDPRLDIFPPGFFTGKTILDVGCNEGWVSCELAQIWGVERVIGVDIDEELVGSAWKRRRTVWSLQAPYERDSERYGTDLTDSENCGQKKRRRDSTEGFSAPEQQGWATSVEDAHYFPASLAHTFGPLPLPSAQGNEQNTFPHNVVFRTADWVKETILEDAAGYDIIIAFSVTKWIHLNDGDDGIRRFFQRAYDTLRSNGKFIVEPQSWDGYAQAKRMNTTLKEHAATLKLRPEDFGEILQSIGFSTCERIGTVGENGFRRPIDVYVKA